jgi:copper resistance protein B
MDLRKHMDTPLLGYVLLDRLEWQNAQEGDRGVWDASGWIGYDLNRLWWRTEGERIGGNFEAAEAHLLYGRAIARWWDLVVGLRQDFDPGPSRSYAALGIQGLAPYWFETQLTFYAGEQGQTAARLEAEYELLLTNRLILQPLLELNAYGQRDLQRGIGAGFSNVEAGLRLRYEIRREFAPYIGLNWNRSLANTADLIRTAGGDVDDLSMVLGLRMWF